MSPPIVWSLEPGILIAVALAGWLYLARWRRVRSSPSPGRTVEAPVWRLCCFAGSEFVVVLALLSPIDSLADRVFFMHMVQHVLLLDVAPILAILGFTKVLLRPLTRLVR